MRLVYYIFFVILILQAFIPQCAQADTGVYDYGYGIISKSMGGTGVASPQDTLVSSINPAGIAYIGSRADFGAVILNPRRGYSASNIGTMPFGVAPGKHYSINNYFFVPNAGYASPWPCSQAVNWGVALYGSGAKNMTYDGNFSGSTILPGNGIFGAGKTLTDLKQLFINFALAWKVKPNFAVGASLITAMQIFQAGGLPFQPFSIDPADVTGRGHDISVGLGTRLGVLYQPREFLAIGASYQPKIFMTKLTRYAGLFPHHGSLDFPPTGVIGVTIKPLCNVNINAEVQEIWHGAVPAYGNPNSCTLTGGPCLGTDGGSGFGWRDTTIFKLGFQWKANELWTWRAGYDYATQTVPKSQVLFNTLAPAVLTNHFTAGFTREITKCMLLSTSFLYAPKVTVTGPNHFNPAQSISIFMRHYEVGASLALLL